VRAEMRRNRREILMEYALLNSEYCGKCMSSTTCQMSRDAFSSSNSVFPGSRARRRYRVSSLVSRGRSMRRTPAVDTRSQVG